MSHSTDAVNERAQPSTKECHVCMCSTSPSPRVRSPFCFAMGSEREASATSASVRGRTRPSPEAFCYRYYSTAGLPTATSCWPVIPPPSTPCNGNNSTNEVSIRCGWYLVVLLSWGKSKSLLWSFWRVPISEFSTDRHGTAALSVSMSAESFSFTQSPPCERYLGVLLSWCTQQLVVSVTCQWVDPPPPRFCEYHNKCSNRESHKRRRLSEV